MLSKIIFLLTSVQGYLILNQEYESVVYCHI